jgi:hypothetical protein
VLGERPDEECNAVDVVAAVLALAVGIEVDGFEVWE